MRTTPIPTRTTRACAVLAAAAGLGLTACSQAPRGESAAPAPGAGTEDTTGPAPTLATSSVATSATSASAAPTPPVVGSPSSTASTPSSAPPSAAPVPANPGGNDWVATTEGVGPIRIGMPQQQLVAQGYVTLTKNVCGAEVTASTAKARGLTIDTDGTSVTGIYLGPRTATRKGIRIGSTEEELKRTYGAQVTPGPPSDQKHRPTYVLPWSDGNWLGFEIDESTKVSGIFVGSPKHKGTNVRTPGYPLTNAQAHDC